jgi:hypothetical protein
MRTLVSAIGIVASLCVATSALAAGDDSPWKRVQRMDPGTRITVSVDGAAPAERYLVQLSDTELVVLNLSAPDLPKRQLLNMAKDNPEWMAGTSKTIYKDSGVRIGPDGVFVKDKKVANLADVIEHIVREKVMSIQK